MMDAATVASVCALAAIAAFSQSLSGFGFSLLFVPPAALVLGPHEAVVTANVLGVVVNAGTLSRVHARVDWGLGLTLFGAAALGMPVGLLVLLYVSRDVLQVLIGATVLVSTLLIWRGWRIRRTGLAADLSAGFTSGVLNTSTSMSGPPIVLYMQGRGFAPGLFRATISAFFLASSSLAVVLYALSGELDRDVAVAAALAAPALGVGWLAGHLLFDRLDEKRFRAVVMGVLLLSAGLALLGPLIS